MGIGERLKQERELKNISLDEVQKVTKIQARYLDAIENERFEVMPGSFYVRAFIKEYANALGLDAEELMEEYKNDLPFEKEENIALSRVKSSKKNKAAVNTPVIFSFLPSMIVVLLIVGIIVLVWLFNQNYFGNGSDPSSADNGDDTAGESVQLPPNQESNPNQEEEEKPTENENAVGKDGEEADVEDSEPTTEISLDSYENNQSYYTVTTTEEKLTITLNTVSQNWIQMENQGGNRLYYETLTTDKSPTEIDISEVEELYIRFAMPQDISISINGQELPLSDEIAPTAVQDAWITIVKQ
ncbi:transcriptional regulator in cluster with unspecified monosaccharide ABC transport system [Gracilibacillus boraciitolerans JCM 21714]|uniref:Transcriptional regulator in cluster with unspecified monosaccharide ABC transport system n=2 Tax=Gracilibacillus boraciitolerans TaxID=307521 RepID=W4VEF5_9BACI|nr:transcriptional regulator in cluster with unspecified monosaccharide ABC transport system [Gracilibacillus boraciitolerans JCM 21714]